jgi:hypothetical protein
MSEQEQAKSVAASFSAQETRRTRSATRKIFWDNGGKSNFNASDMLNFCINHTHGRWRPAAEWATRGELLAGFLVQATANGISKLAKLD